MTPSLNRKGFGQSLEDGQAFHWRNREANQAGEHHEQRLRDGARKSPGRLCSIKYQGHGCGFSFTDNGREEKAYGRFWVGKECQ